MSDITILIIEDDKDLSKLMKDYLDNEGYQVIQIYNGTQAVKAAREYSPTLILLDIMLPGLDGIEICKQLRTFTYCPILVISARSSDSDKLLSLGLGADDYLTKPFSFVEMVGRVKSHIRRFTSFQADSWKNSKQQSKTVGDIVIDPTTCMVTVSGNNIQLTAKEFKLVDFLSSHPSQVFTKDQLLNAVWGHDAFIDDNTVAVYVGRLREKLFKDHNCYIKTIWGIGYKWDISNTEL